MRRILKLPLIALALAGVVAVGVAVWPIEASVPGIERSGNPQKGAYLARMAGCIGCHTDSENSGAPLAGGVALKTDFGTFHSPNLTTDKEHGIGAWTVNDFAKAVRQGISPEGKPYYPAFPYAFYSRLTDQDIADLWAAFQTVPPVAVPSKPQDLVPPFNFRPALKLWRGMFFRPEPYKPDRAKSDLWNRGKYIVEGPAHCGACHTPRNAMGARQVEQRLHGADGLPGGGKSPPITKAHLRQNGWTVETLKYALKTGILPNGDVFGGSMGEVVRDGTAFLSEQDLRAISIYLLDADAGS
ncbi:cytochrome c [Rhizobiales bacterium]|uniref:c-type cytochrome n=1 Tax=Hongsoonwoonella zoysiae TaxID=2821844 RepID=UPI0015604A4E|nr:cytochrome c [Hongsoonwoonella zoysiae]NRG18792.1 cytochrome c [Hongsoonwoonella zoysiae]